MACWSVGRSNVFLFFFFLHQATVGCDEFWMEKWTGTGTWLEWTGMEWMTDDRVISYQYRDDEVKHTWRRWLFLFLVVFQSNLSLRLERRLRRGTVKIKTSYHKTQTKNKINLKEKHPRRCHLYIYTETKYWRQRNRKRHTCSKCIHWFKLSIYVNGKKNLFSSRVDDDLGPSFSVASCLNIVCMY